MPELPFLQVLAENLDAQLRGHEVAVVRLSSVSLLKTYEPPLDLLTGRAVRQVRRQGKLILFDLAGDLSLIVHLMRDGRFRIGPSRSRGGKDLALALRFDDGRELQLVELGPKKRAAVWLSRTDELARAEPLRDLGLDPFSYELAPERLHAMLAGERTQLKRFLTFQRYVTGIGNAYSDEILWEGRLSPFAAASKATPAEATILLGAIRTALGRALEEHRAHFGETLPSKEPPELLRVHRHADEPCPRCGTPIAQVAFAERETYYCPSCQTGGKVYADRRMSRLLK